jgi:hypothetical protein
MREIVISLGVDGILILKQILNCDKIESDGRLL